MSNNDINSIFPPEQCSEDILAGYLDGTGGVIEDFFAGLSTVDRESVQWYAAQGMGPFQVEGYVRELVKGYAALDARREYQDALQGVVSELDRVERYMTLFFDSTVFPRLTKYNVAIYDDARVYQGSHDVDGWGVLAYASGPLSHRNMQTMLESRARLMFAESKAFLADSSAGGSWYSQPEIDEEFANDARTR